MILSFAKIKQGFEESNFAPLLYLKTKKIIKKGILFPSISYGGYTRDTNVGLTYSTGKKVRLLIGTNHLQNILDNNTRTAISIFINLSTKF